MASYFSVQNVGVLSGFLAARGHSVESKRLFPFSFGPATPILGSRVLPFTELNTQQQNLITADADLHKGAWVTLAPLFCTFSKTFSLFQFPHLSAWPALPLPSADPPLSALMSFPYYVAFHSKQNLASRPIAKILMIAPDKCDAVQSRWEISKCFLLRGSQPSLPVS